MRHVYLALHAAFPLSLSPDLLYLLRDNFQRDVHGRLLDIPWEAVSDLLLSELCQETGHEAFRMEPEVRAYLLGRLRSMPRFGEARILELQQFIGQYYGPQRFSAAPEVRALAEAQLWAAQLQAQPEEAVRTLSETLYTAQSQGDLSLQLRLHYLLEGFPNLADDSAQLQHYSRAVAMDGLGLVADAREAAKALHVSGNAVVIGGVTFGVKEEWRVGEGEGREEEEPSSFFVWSIDMMFAESDSELAGELGSVCNQLVAEGLAKATAFQTELSDLQLWQDNQGSGGISVLVILVSDAWLGQLRGASAWFAAVKKAQGEGHLKVVTVDIEQYDTLFTQVEEDAGIDLTSMINWLNVEELRPHFARELKAVIGRMRETDRAKSDFRNTLQQLRWLGLYDGSLEEDWKGIEKFVKMRSLILPGDAHPILMGSQEEWVAYTRERISQFREQMPQIQVHVENWEKLREYVEPVLDFWRVRQSNAIEPQVIQGQTSSHNILDDQAVETKDLVVIGVDQEWLRSSRYDSIVPSVREAGKPILPVILSPCEWQNSALGEYSKVPDEAGWLEEVREWEDRLREVQVVLGRKLGEAAEKVMARDADRALEESEEGKARVRELQQQLRWLGEYEGELDGEWASIAGFYPDLAGQPFEARVEVAGKRNREARGEVEGLVVSVDNLGEYQEVFSPVLDWWRVRRVEGELFPSKFGKLQEQIVQRHASGSLEMDVCMLGIDRKLVAEFDIEPILQVITETKIGIVAFYTEHCTISDRIRVFVQPSEGFILGGTWLEKVTKAQLKLGKALRDALRRKLEPKAEEKPEPQSKEPDPIPPVIQELLDSMTFVQGGSFMMGDDKGDTDESPAHKVIVSDFYIGKYEVTQEQWEAVMGNNPSYFKGVRHPVDFVSWRDCQAFVERLSGLTGRRFRLPTEAEWEYAARGGRQGKGFVYAGSDDLDEVGWYAENSRNSPQPVGMKQPNELGLYDMSGNVWEWCQDGYDERYYGRSEGMLNPRGAVETTRRVLRGGMAGVNAAMCRVTHRSMDEMQNPALISGLRVVMDADHAGLHPEIQKLVRDMVYVEGGEFMMGDDKWIGEMPPHRVRLDGFHIQRYLVTQAQWEAVMGRNPSHFKGNANAADCPVESVSWHDCHDFLKRLKKLTGLGFRLPTEAEWEYAARGGQQGIASKDTTEGGLLAALNPLKRSKRKQPKAHTYSGSNDIDVVAWYDGNSGTRTHPVGLLRPNGLGLHDMSGNVWEWCQDWYDRGYYVKSRLDNPKGPKTGHSVVLRGGSWVSFPEYCRVSNRNGDRPGNHDNDVGVRLARD